MELINENELNNETLNVLYSDEPNWLKEHRTNSLSMFKELQMPEFKYGLSITLNPKNFNLNINEFISSLKQPIDIEIKNKDKIEIISFKENYPKVKEYINRLVKYDENKFTSFHNAFFNNGLFIRIPKNTEVDLPLIINKKINQKYSFEYVVIVAEPFSKIKIIENASSELKEIFRSKIVEVFIEEGAKVTYMDIQDFNDNAYSFNIKKADVERDSEIKWIDCVFGSHLTKAETISELNAEGANVQNFGVFFGNSNEQFDIFTSAVHNAPRTFSNMLIKGALDNKSKAVYQGLIHITKDAPFSNGYQKEDTLLLSENAEVDPIPKLLIDNNNVRCTHGATIGEIDKEKLFYLMSRGLSEKQAKEEFVKGFFNPVIDQINEENIQDNLKKIIEEKLRL